MALSIKHKLIISGTLLAFIPALIISIALSTIAVNEASEALEHSSIEHVTAMREDTAQIIQRYFKQLENQAVTLSSNLMVVDAMNTLPELFNATASEQLEQQKQLLLNYYRQTVASNFSAAGENDSFKPERLLSSATPQTISLQYDYIATNSAKPGEKDKLNTASGNTEYDKAHARVHPVLRQYLQRFGFYDIFLVEPEQGNVVYSVFKEIDFATSLKHGAFANSGLAEAFNRAVKAESAEFVYLTDFSAYLPSYNAPAAFISTPIFKQNKMIGVLIFQMPIDHVNDIMTHQQQWAKAGLGQSGETFLVGSDFKLRSNARGFIERKDGFISSLKNSTLNSNVAQQVERKNTSIGLVSVDNAATRAAINGEVGVKLFTDETGTPVLAAYRQVQLLNLNWALVSKISEHEAFAAIAAIRAKVFNTTVITSLIALITGASLGWVLARLLLRPVNAMIRMVYDIAEGENDLSVRLKIRGNDETTKLATGINLFIARIDSTFSQLLKSVARLVPMSQELSTVNSQLTNATFEQKNLASTVSACLNETNNAAKVVDAELNNIDSATAQGRTEVDNSIVSVNDVAKTMQQLSTNIGQAVHALDKLQSNTKDINVIIDVINSIAEQTNLLALNAAIEAARAGDAGRGFAVVADEVRALASKTRESTQQVNDMITAIQSGTQNVVSLMQLGKANTDSSTQQVNDAALQLSDVSNAMTNIADCVAHISEAIAQQQDSIHQVTTKYDLMNKSFETSYASADDANTVGKDMNKLGDMLLSKIKSFKVSDSTWSTSKRSKLRKDETKSE